MNIFITSSPYIENADKALLNPANNFVDRLREVLPENPTVLFVASDPDSHGLTCSWGADTVSAFNLAGMPFSGYAVLDGENEEEADFLIGRSDLIIFAGGHVPTQSAWFQHLGLREKLEDFDGTLMGISAGSMNLADTVYVQPEEEGEGIDPDFERFAPGLGVTDINILPHYQKVRNYMLDGLRLFEDITYSDSMDHTFFALPDGSYIFQSEDECLLCGRAYLIRDGVREYLTEDGDCMDLNELE